MHSILWFSSNLGLKDFYHERNFIDVIMLTVYNQFWFRKFISKLFGRWIFHKKPSRLYFVLSAAYWITIFNIGHFLITSHRKVWNRARTHLLKIGIFGETLFECGLYVYERGFDLIFACSTAHVHRDILLKISIFDVLDIKPFPSV